MAQHSHPPRRVAQSPKQNTFFGGAAVLAAGILVVKLIGLFYKIPLLNIIGEQGTADFGNAYNIYAVLLTISTAGLPVAVSKLVSEANALGRQNQVRRTFRLAMALFLTLGVLSFLVMFFCADQLAGLMHDSMAAPGIKVLAPAVICVGCLSAFRGYAQGHGRMTPTAVSQIIEALCKLTVGLGLAYWLVKHGSDASHAAAGAITGVTVGTIVALVYMLMNFLITRGREGSLSDDRPDDALTILKDLLMIAVPITISSSMVGIVTVIDSSLVQGQLQRALLENPDTWALYQGIVDFTDLEQALKAWKTALPQGGAVTMSLLEQSMAGQGGQAEAALALHTTLESISRTLYGNYNGALNIYNLPTSLMAAVTAAVIPAVSGALARRDRRGAGRITGSGGLPHGGGSVCAGQAHHGPDLPQSERRSGRPPSVHPGSGYPVCVHDAGVQLHPPGPRLCQPSCGYHAAGRGGEDLYQLPCSCCTQHGDLWGPYGQYPVLRPLYGAGPGGHRPGDPPAAVLFPGVCQAGGGLCPDGSGCLGGVRPAVQGPDGCREAV